jgi:hypothetical protein
MLVPQVQKKLCTIKAALLRSFMDGIETQKNTKQFFGQCRQVKD